MRQASRGPALCAAVVACLSPDDQHGRERNRTGQFSYVVLWVGTKSVGTIDAPLNSTLDWTCSGDCRGFAITNNPDDTSTIALRASGMSGSTPIVAGTYHDVRVITGGRWTFTIVPADGP